MRSTMDLQLSYQLWLDLVVQWKNCSGFPKFNITVAANLNSWNSDNSEFPTRRCVILRTRNILTKLGEDWSLSEEMAAALRNTTCRQPPSWTLMIEIVLTSRSVLHRIPNILTKFDEDLSLSKEKKARFYEIQHGGSRHLEKYASG